MRFENFIENNYPGLNFLSVSNPEFLPGVIINHNDKIVDSMDELFTSLCPKRLQTKQARNLCTGGTVSGTRKLEPGIKVLGVFGVNLGVTAEYTVTFQFDQVCPVVFDTPNGSVCEHEIRGLINDLKIKDRQRWKEIVHDYMVTEAIYIDSFVVEISRNEVVLSASEMAKCVHELNIEAQHSWLTYYKMKIENNANPFGVRGFPIKRFM